jgi:type I restriction-modification system DNA methylase subunit
MTPKSAASADQGHCGRDAAGARTIHDPACGTGGFLMIAHDYVSQHYELDRTQNKYLKLKALSGNELVDSVAPSA